MTQGELHQKIMEVIKVLDGLSIPDAYTILELAKEKAYSEAIVTYPKPK